MQDFRVKSGLRVSGNVYGVDYLTANNINVTYNGIFGNLTVNGSLVGNVTGTVSSLSNQTTSNLAEGTNQYYTNARAYANLTAASINALADVDTVTTPPTAGYGLLWNGTAWVPTAITASFAEFSNIANVAAVATFSNNANIANVALTSNIANTALRAVVSAQADNANTATFATFATNSNTANSAGFATLAYTALAANFASSANTANTALRADVATQADNANTALTANTVSSLNNFTTANLAEGTNLYYTNARAYANLTLASINALADVDTTTLPPNSGYGLIWNGTAWAPNVITVSSSELANVANTVVGIVQSSLVANTAFFASNSNIANIALTANVANTVLSISNFTTANLAEGNNLYYTNARVEAAIQPTVAELRALVSRFNSNVLYVAQNGNDANDGTTMGNAFANIHVALAAATQWTTVFLKSGDYRLYNQPVTIPRRVALVGDNLRTTTVRPTQPSVDMFYVENASYVTGITFRDHISPAAVFSYNPNGSAGTIVTSPYIQNCSSITTTGTGMRVDGRYVSGLRSMVCDAYTQTNEGGIGIHMLNKGYTQLVSVFTICCHIAIKCESGGFCSVTNSNASFGTYGLWADGVSEPLYYGKLSSAVTEATNDVIISNLPIRPNYGDSVLFANFNQDKCSRDTGLIVDSLAFDLAYGSNTQSNFAGLQYWSQTDSAIPNQSIETRNAINVAAQIAVQLAQGTTVSQVYQSNVSPSNGTGGTAVESARLQTNFNIVTNIIQNGTVGVTDTIVPNQYPANTNVNVSNAANLVINNKTFIAAEVIGYIDSTYPGFWANTTFLDSANAQAKCSRDVGYILESVTFDLRHNGNRQSVTAGTFYYQYNANTTQINNQVVQTGLSYDYIGSIIANVVLATSVAKGYNSAKCERDTGLIVDSIALDLLYTGNSQANFAGLQYWSQTSSAIPNQSVETIAAINYVMNTSYKIAIGNAYTPLQGNVAYVSGTVGDGTSGNVLVARIGNVISIIQNGTVGVTDSIVPNDLYPTANVSRNNVANIVIANKAFIAAETIAYIDQTYPGFWANTAFINSANATATCSRDVGFILDSAVFDLLHNGNKQSIQAGTFYYQYNANTTQINNQIVKTGQAYAFIGRLVSNIIANTTITSLYQTTVTQNTSAAPAATISEVNKTAQSIGLINNIITNGPSVSLPKTPIGANVSVDVNVRNAANAIIANRDFIKAETIAYVDLELFDPPYQIAVKQNTNAAPAATFAEANVVLDRITLIKNIITNGPSVAAPKVPITNTPSANTNVMNATKLILANRDYIKAEVLEYVNRSWANISNGSGTFYTVRSATDLVGNTSTVTLLETINENILANSRVSFHQGSYISSSGHTFEYVGSGTTIATALPSLGGVPIQENEVRELRGGKVYFTSTDQLGDFRIGTGLVINRVDGTITGRTFNKALFAVMTPYMLAIEG